ncbi:hypothetical protein [Micromonospora sp. WMMD1082]|uniref:hypothetical protein n=1 Tax=Micromonospora sp. WMMD1082 TaxID=3016104 RepID=UPI002416358F|nr:hypothetical protein [Micromonospora sp. WMMD1082]MDG4792431.1 hypothetical protein [Micromonospora sp. WMMD1082]
MSRRAPTLIAAAVCLALAGCGADTSPPAEAAPTSSTPASSSPSPAPVATLDPKTACIRATNLVADATTDLIGELVDHPDGSTIDRTLLSNTIADMEALRPSMPEGLGADLGDLVEPLKQLQEAFDTGVNRTINTGVYRSRGPGLIIACGQYTGS